MNKSEIFNKRLIWITGKGGVGKSTVSSSLALLGARQGKKILLIEISPKSRISRLLGSHEIKYKEREVLPNFWALNIEPKHSLEEYMKLQLKFKFFYDRILKNKLFRIFSTALPGLDDLTTAGKIWYMENLKDNNGKPLFDTIIVDAPATGHCINLLKIPETTINTARVGPIKNQTEPILELFQDPVRSMVNIVTLPEKMPVNETLEFMDIVRKLNMPVGMVIINSLFPEPFEKSKFNEIISNISEEHFEYIYDIISTIQDKSEKQRLAIKPLLSEFKNMKIQLPYLFSSGFGKKEIEILVNRINTELSIG